MYVVVPRRYAGQSRKANIAQISRAYKVFSKSWRA